MKLEAKYQRATFVAVLFVLLLTATSYYILIYNALINQLDESLKVEEQEITNFVNVNKYLPEESHFSDQQIDFDSTDKIVSRKFISSKIYSKEEKELELIRQLIFTVKVKDAYYIATVSKPQSETEDLLILILLNTAGVILFLFVVLFIANRIFIKKLWQPFYIMLHQMKEFNLARPGKLAMVGTKIEEFTALEEAWTNLTKKINKDYETLKSFVDNASHEMQTPLAIVNSKLDLLIQDSHLTKDNVLHLQSMYDAINKLTRLNQSLLLLAKIEYDQFPGKQEVDLNELIKQRLIGLEELIQGRKLQVTTNLSAMKVLMHPQLADMLVSNLLINAIRHNIPGGNIYIEGNEEHFSIQNTGEANELNRHTVFNRFQKHSQSDGVGLGLAIVKQICETHHFLVIYAFNNGIHHFELTLKT